MLKKWILGTVLLSASAFTQADVITSVITGADMEGIEVTALFSNGSTDMQTWQATNATDGGVMTDLWSLSLEGTTFGEYDQDNDQLYGDWTLTNYNESGIVGLLVNGAPVGVLFDILEGTDNNTPGSEAGRPFVSSLGTDVTASFSDIYSSPDLFFTLGILWNEGASLGTDQSMVFLTDTDKVEVPEPSTLFVFAAGLIALARVNRKS